MAHGHKLVHQVMQVDAVALGTLGARIAINLDASFTGIESSFLMKRVRYLLQLVGRTIADDGPIAVLINHGNASLGEIAAAMQMDNVIGPSDATQSLTEDDAWMVYQNTVKTFQLSGDGTEGVIDSGWMDFGGRNGIPAQENGGFAAHAFNCGSGALTTGSSINGLIQIQGVWLRD